jgi:hypothetical protein
MRVRCASCRGLRGSAGVQGGLRRGAHGAVLLWGVVGARVVCVGEGMQEGHALIPVAAPGLRERLAVALAPAGAR